MQKILAQPMHWREAPLAMKQNAARRQRNLGRAFVATFLAFTFGWAVALSASPRLHARVHSDANRVDHTCAVTMIASGSYDHATHVPLVSALAPAIQFSKVLALTPQWVESPFLGASIFEHAPPLNS